jgi:hypothetical protein
LFANPYKGCVSTGNSHEANLTSAEESDGMSLEETSECEEKSLRKFFRVMDPDWMVVEENIFHSPLQGIWICTREVSG